MASANKGWWPVTEQMLYYNYKGEKAIKKIKAWAKSTYLRGVRLICSMCAQQVPYLG